MHLSPRKLSITVSMIALAALCAGSASAGVLFAIDPSRQVISKIDPATGAETASIPTPEAVAGGAEGLAAADCRVWFFKGNTTNLIHELDASSGAVVNSFPAPVAGAVDGLAFDGGTLYLLEPSTDSIHRVDPASGTLLGSCNTGLGAVAGLAAEGGRLFAVLGFFQIAELDPVSCAVVGGPFAGPSGDFVLGLGFDGQTLYAGGFTTATIFSMDPADGTVTGSMNVGYVPSGLAALEVATVGPRLIQVDIKPGACPPNPLNVRSRGMTPVAVLGSDELDVREIDPESVTLAGVSPRRSTYADSASSADCSLLNADGHLDLVLHFRTQELVAAIERQEAEMHDGMVTTLELAAGTFGDAGEQLAGQDTVMLLGVDAGPSNEDAPSGHARHERDERPGRHDRARGRR